MLIDQQAILQLSNPSMAIHVSSCKADIVRGGKFSPAISLYNSHSGCSTFYTQPLCHHYCSIIASKTALSVMCSVDPGLTQGDKLQIKL